MYRYAKAPRRYAGLEKILKVVEWPNGRMIQRKALSPGLAAHAATATGLASGTAQPWQFLAANLHPHWRFRWFSLL